MGYELSTHGANVLQEIYARTEGNASAGNGRLARNICEAVIRAHALRLSKIDQPTLEDLTLLTQRIFYRPVVLLDEKNHKIFMVFAFLHFAISIHCVYHRFCAFDELVSP
ncbi:hypothetical protein [Bacillus spongiae]|uniref:hypothetical protein n=1 Tax=Bacillus spongiae TaxID=2683610 RepID=UPI003AF6BF81